MGKLEKLLWGLESPKWQDVWKDTDLSTIDNDRVKVGRRLYAEKCIACHALPIDRKNGDTEITVTMVPIGKIGTDPTAAINFVSRANPDGALLTDSVGRVLVQEFFGNKTDTLETIKAGQPVFIQEFIEEIAKEKFERFGQADLAEKKQMIKEFLKAMKIEQFKWDKTKLASKGEAEQICAKNFLCYKARPLNGVWATGPYLHNGSVRTIRQLLVPRERQKEFNVGGREFDPMGMGFKDAGNFVMDTTLKGNLNTGHDSYGNDFEDDNSLKALMEYLKTL